MSFSHSATPSGDLGTGRVTEQPSIDLASVEYMASYACIAEAWKKVRANKGAPGVDNITTMVFPEWARPQWKRIHRQLVDGTYQPQPALRVEIPKETGGVRLLGSPVSPVLSNILLDDLDKELEARGHKFVRYADDLAIFVKSKLAGERVLASVRRFLEHKLKVKVNQAKSYVKPVKQSAVLGFEIHHKKLRTQDGKVNVFQEKLKRITRRCPGLSIAARVCRLRSYIRGWMAHYGCGLKYNDAVRLDGWIRRRLRMAYWKQWKRPRRRIRALIRLGVNKREAIQLGLSRKSYWRLSKTLATNSGLSNAHFQEIGLLSVRELWCKIHHPATAR